MAATGWLGKGYRFYVYRETDGGQSQIGWWNYPEAASRTIENELGEFCREPQAGVFHLSVVVIKEPEPEAKDPKERSNDVD